MGVVWHSLYWVNKKFWDWLLFRVMPFDKTTKLGESTRFFFYDSTKIILLLVGITFVVTILRSYITIERTRAFLGGKRPGIGNFIVALAGVVTPFCSCSAVPVFIGFLSSGVPIGTTLSFLISGLAIAITAGIIMGKMKVERWVEPFVYANQMNAQSEFASLNYLFRERIQMGAEESWAILKKIWPYLLAGIAVGALIHGWAPTDFFAKYAGPGNPFGVFIAVIVGIPLYSNAAGVMPIVQALYDKGLPMGTLLAFMMAVVALSFPEMIPLRRVLRPKLLAAYIGVVGTGIVFIGYLFNAILN
jgi:uncharacterized membrane protein YraQ (UPF0718 family)